MQYFLIQFFPGVLKLSNNIDGILQCQFFVKNVLKNGLHFGRKWDKMSYKKIWENFEFVNVVGAKIM